MAQPTIELSTLLNVRYDREVAAVKNILAEETMLRQRLAELAEHEKSAQAELANDPSLRSVGADSLWQSWLGRNRSDLNMRLARTLALKHDAQARLSLAFGRKLVAEELVRAQQSKVKVDRIRTAQNVALQMSLFKTW